ncbi:MAG: hypothetical protein COS39_04410 [Hydrogenophilales bacterium CG03_land_8_20_14_0_80_62_28]|nr:DUF3460 family protein [Betaproteobacteria bacterium]OIO77088.1 MAG: hypothetical protein AUJ86_09875 [Hydrogenophilaceae bacterium CG1_02_62_390]PIV23420.1 MAG: hypothetical protein COS39_04410 [Hydrogenophilales bacterium CG03_land_8_20_14_0_80_62_28]PIW37730.1 MAG: hypothetical protein COW23_10145 [Hydrogenophilales bacterium CG15_BIG_FIL_POST_REV_8_21_14_020_62_31]PIW71550.1 MAG: hypothetical protein COW07_07570 [Hydrogenophilales bacterium CG12_big_fil_rev_8_21_14_0_65_61_21]PIX01498.1
MKRSEFTRGDFMTYMDQFLEQHPGVVKDQRQGWNIYWNPRKSAPECLVSSATGSSLGKR